ncbi:MAG TPA: dihydrodipicolinate synthase family protein [Bryobacteraceae bacterium]|nr:dihydrodipicolinate synthase family protein [Bryobacteraceae bacterium]
MKSPPTIAGLRTVHAAAITPRGKSGDLNFGALFELIDYLSAARMGGIALFTRWGEYPALSVEERARVTYLAVKRSRVPVLAGVGSATFDHSLELAREARSAGVSAILLPPPHFYLCDEDDVCEFFTQFAVQLGSAPPIVITGSLTPETACRLLESGRFGGIVEDGGDSAVDHLRAAAIDSAVLAGDDRALVPARRAGLGVLSAAACAAPELTMALDAAIATGNGEAIARLEGQRQELLHWLDRFPSPVGVKTAVAARGIQTGPLPVPLSAAKQQCLSQFREWFQAWLPASRKLASHA